MTVPTSVAISTLSNTNNLNLSTNQATSCLSLVSSTNGNPLSIPISIGNNLAANTQQQTTMSWAPQGNPIQFAAVMPQQTIYQMPNDTILQPQTMLITQPSSRPPDQTTNAQTSGQIVQIIQTPNGPAQFYQTSSNLKQQNTYTTNLMNSNMNVTNTTTNSKSNKQILPKGSRSKKNNNNNSDQSTSTCTNSTSTINSKSSSSASSNNKTLITTSLASAPTINNFTTNLNQSTMGAPQLMLNTQSGGFFTSNGLFFNQMPTLSTMGQQQFIINPNNQLGNPAANTGTQTGNKTTPQQNQTIFIPNSTTNNNQLKLQPTGLMPQTSAPQLIQLPNGQMILVQPTQTSNEQQPTLIQNFNQPNTLQLIQQPDGQTVSYSSSNNNFIFTSQPSFVNSNISTSNLLTTTTTTMNTSLAANNTSSNNNKIKSRKKPPAKKDNKNSKVETTNPPSIEPNKSKGLNLADLLIEAGILDDGSPPTSPLLNQTTITPTADLLLDQSLNASTNTTTNSNAPQLSTVDLNDQQTNLLSNQPTNASLGQQTMVTMMPSNGGQGAANYYFNPLNQSINANSAPVNNAINSSINQPQFKLALAPDGSVILQTVPTFAQPLPPTNQLTQQTVQSNTSLSTKFVDTIKSNQLDSCNSGSSQPSPDSTTPTLDTAITPTSCSSLSVTTSTITFTTNNSTSTNSNSQLGSIKLTDSMSLTVSGQQPINDEFNSQTTTSTMNVSPAKTKSRAKRSNAKKQTSISKSNNSPITQTLPQSTLQPQQLITIPLQANLNSSMNSVIPNTGTVIIGDNSMLNNTSNLSYKKNDQGILVLNSSGVATNQMTNQSAPVPLTAHIDQSGVPVVQISLNNQEFLERLDTQVKSLSSIKNPTQEQETLLQELKSLQMKMLQAKTNANETGDNNIILTSQPLLSQPAQQANVGGSSGPNKSLTNSKLTKDNNVNNANSTTSTIQTSNTQIYTITSKPLDTTCLQSNSKLSIANSSLMDQTKSTASTLQAQPTQIIFQSATPTSMKPPVEQTNHNQLQLISPDPGHTTNTFEGQKIKILTTTSTAQTTAAPQPGTTFQLGNQFFTITTAGKNPLQNQMNTDGTSTQTVYQVLHLQPPTNTITNLELINNNAKLIKLPDGQTAKDSLPPTISDKAKSKSPKCSFQQQLSADCAAASKPDTKTPFKNYNDACKRLLRYHVFYQEDMKKEKLKKFDDDFEVLSQYLLYKREQLHRRFQYNILKLAMKTHSTAEDIMLDKLFVEEEKNCLQNDKESVAKGNYLDLPEPPYKWRGKINSLVEEEMNKQNDEAKKRKIEETEEESEQSDSKTLKKSDLPIVVVNESEDEEEESEASGEESNDMHEFNKYLDNLNDINQIDGLSPLYNSNSYNSMMQITDHQTGTANQSDTNLQSSHHTNTFNLFNPDWPNTETTTSSTTNQQSNKPSNWVQEDAVAVESILGGEVNASESNYIETNLNHLDEFNDEEHENNQMDFNQTNNDDLIFDHPKNDNSTGHLKMHPENDMQMQSAIDSILDMLVPPTNSSVPTNENGISTSHDGGVLVGSDQLSSNGFSVNFDTNLTTSSQVNFSQQNNYLSPMPSIGMQARQAGTFGTDHYNDQIDEAVKSIL